MTVKKNLRVDDGCGFFQKLNLLEVCFGGIWMVPFLFQPFFFLGGSDLLDLYSFFRKILGGYFSSVWGFNISFFGIFWVYVVDVPKIHRCDNRIWLTQQMAPPYRP